MLVFPDVQASANLPSYYMILVRSRGFSDKHYMDAHVCTNISDAKVLNVVCHKLFKHEKGPSILEPCGGLKPFFPVK